MRGIRLLRFLRAPPRAGREVALDVLGQLPEFVACRAEDHLILAGVVHLIDRNVDQFRRAEAGLREVRPGVDDDVRHLVVPRVDDDRMQPPEVFPVLAFDVRAVVEVVEEGTLAALVLRLPLLRERCRPLARVLRLEHLARHLRLQLEPSSSDISRAPHGRLLDVADGERPALEDLRRDLFRRRHQLVRGHDPRDEAEA